MLGRTVNWIVITICSMIIGWTLCLFFQDYGLFVLDWSIGMADVLSIIIDIILAIVIALLIEKSINNTRVEKDYFISELDTVNDIYSELEKICASETVLSLQNVTYNLGRSRKNLQRMWKMMNEVNNTFHKSSQDEFDAIIEQIRSIDSKLTDTSTFKESDGFHPIKIARNHIYLNNSVKPEIDKDFTTLKEKIFHLKIKINRI